MIRVLVRKYSFVVPLFPIMLIDHSVVPPIPTIFINHSVKSIVSDKVKSEKNLLKTFVPFFCCFLFYTSGISVQV